MGPTITSEILKNEIVSIRFVVDELITIAIVRMKNGFKVIGESACASPDRFNKELGEQAALSNAIEKMWVLLGYELKSMIALALTLPPTAIKDMKVYVGKKAVHARPMNRRDYNAFRGWTMPVNEDGSDLGYLLEYPDGYISWSPKDTFEASYQLME